MRNVFDIKKNEQGDESVVLEIKKSQKKTFIYGCGAFAEAVCQYLMGEGIKKEGFLVDSDYYQENCYLSGMLVRCIDEYIDVLDSINIVIGFCDLQKTRFILNNSKLMRGSYYHIWGYNKDCTWDEEFFLQNREIFEQIFDELADEKSKKVFLALIYAKINHVVGQLLDYADANQYFNELTFESNPENEIFIDCGAYNGDTIQQYILFTGKKYKKIFAFEPDFDNFTRLQKMTESNGKIQIINKGTWDSETVLFFDSKGSGSLITDAGNEKVNVTTIDETVKGEKVTFIKMDIEGSELISLKGAKNTIMNHFPKLAICCYHKVTDILDIYMFIKSIDYDNRYRIYFRHHSGCASETVLYAIPK